MKLSKYFVPLRCPWCHNEIMIVNHHINEVLTATIICKECQARLDAISDNIIMIVDDAWLEPDIQKNNVPIYPFVRGILVTHVKPPADVPYWQNRYAILPMKFAKVFGFPSHAIHAMNRGSSPVIFDDAAMRQQHKVLPVMRVGSC